MWLSREDLKILTGTSKKEMQIKHLQEHRYVFDTDIKGYPVLLISHIESKLGAKVASTKRTEPNFEALRTVMRGQKKTNK